MEYEEHCDKIFKMRIILMFTWTAITIVAAIGLVPLLYFFMTFTEDTILLFFFLISCAATITLNLYLTFKFITDHEYKVSRKVIFIYAITTIPFVCTLILVTYNFYN